MGRLKVFLAAVGPGILVAATGVGAGDLATASIAGNKLGLTILWAVVVGAFVKFVLNEGLTRWQLATGSTLLEGSIERLGRVLVWIFMIYLFIWSFFVGAALMSAVGVTLHAVFPLVQTNGAPDAAADKAIYGAVMSLLAYFLVRIGGFKLFEKVMNVCIGVMFVVVTLTAIALMPSFSEFLSGLLIPRIPDIENITDEVDWTVALMGGVGGTVTILCYGYWIREAGRSSIADLSSCRIDLATGYVVTALFGLALVVIGASLSKLDGKGATLVVDIATRLENLEGFGAAAPAAKWAFLVGAFGAVFSSLLGVWQAVPYLFADLWYLRDGQGDRLSPAKLVASIPYRLFQIGLATIPIAGLLFSFTSVQKVYAIIGALFMPMMCVVLLILNTKHIGEKHANRWWTNVLLILVMAFFLWILWTKIAVVAKAVGFIAN